MTNSPTTEPEPAPPRPFQFTIESLMILTAVVAGFFAWATQVPHRFFYYYPLVWPIYFALGLIVLLSYSIRVKPSLFSIVLFIGSFISFIAYAIVLEKYLFYKYELLSYFTLSNIIIVSLALFSSIANSKKRTGSWFPFVGERQVSKEPEKELIRLISEARQKIDALALQEDLDSFEKNAFGFIRDRLFQIEQECMSGNLTPKDERYHEMGRISEESNPEKLPPVIGGQLIDIEKKWQSL